MAGELILIADDSKENREFILDYVLTPNGLRGVEARHGIECLEIARRESPDLILLDLQMPRLDGRGVLEALRRENLNIPVILMTFYGSEEIAVEVFRMGVRDYLKKPYTQEEMLQAIEANLTETRLRREKEALTSRLLSANRELNSRIRELKAIYGVGKSVASMTEPGQVFARVVEAAVTVTNAEQGRLLLVEEKGLVLRAVKRRGEPHARVMAEPAHDRIADHVVSKGQHLNLGAADLARLKIPILAALYVPMLVNQRAVGVLVIEQLTNAGRPFNQNDGVLLSALGDYAVIAAENARQSEALEEARDRGQAVIRGALERNVAPSVVERLIGSSNALESIGQQREVSIILAELRNYSIDGDPEAVIETLNRYLSLATEILFAREGTLVEVHGDSLMAFFNAPLDQENHAYLAVDAALSLILAVDDMAEKVGGAITFAIGVSMGTALVGKVGVPHAMNYTCLGDVVTVARRLEELAEPGQILCDEAIITRLGQLADARRVGEIPVKNRRAPISVYDLQGLADWPEQA